MKRNIITAMVAALACLMGTAAQYKYFRTVREGVQWVRLSCPGAPEDDEVLQNLYTFVEEFKGDSVVSGETYKKLYRYRAGESIDARPPVALMREKGRQVFAILPNPANRHPNSKVTNEETGEFLVYDYYDMLNAMENWGVDEGAECTVDEVEVGEYLRYRMRFGEMTWIEGIGKTGTGTLYQNYPTQTYTGGDSDGYYHYYDFPLLSHVVEEGKTVYQSYGYELYTSLFKRYDVDGNNVVNGSDVTALYDVLLNGGEAPAGADVDGNGVINGSDVTTLYNRLLK